MYVNIYIYICHETWFHRIRADVFFLTQFQRVVVLEKKDPESHWISSHTCRVYLNQVSGSDPCLSGTLWTQDINII